MDIHLCSMPQSLRENLRRECTNRHCKASQPAVTAWELRPPLLNRLQRPSVTTETRRYTAKGPGSDGDKQFSGGGRGPGTEWSHTENCPRLRPRAPGQAALTGVRAPGGQAGNKAHSHGQGRAYFHKPQEEAWGPMGEVSVKCFKTFCDF